MGREVLRVVELLRRVRVPGPVRDTAPFTLSIALALIAVAIAGSPAAHRAEPATRAALAAPANPGVDQFASLHMSRNRPLAQVEDHYAFIEREHAVPARVRGYLPLYEEAARTFGVNWHLIASIHRQETAFSASTTTYHGVNFAGCCAGPMQFNITNGPVSTWDRYRGAFREGTRPAVYPHRTAKHPSIYDDFDSIMAAGKLLSANGGDDLLGRNAWNAAYDYYGHDLFGITYADTVVARAQGWARDGFCVNCLVDDKLIKGLDKRFGRSERKLLVDTVAAAPKKTKKQLREEARKRRHRRNVARRKHHKAVAARKAAAEQAATERKRAGKVGKRTGKTQVKAKPTPTAVAQKPTKPGATPTPVKQKPKPTTTPSNPTATATSPPTATPTPDLVGALLDGGHGGG